MEIDLLRNGEPLPMSGGIQSTYRILISRASSRPEAELYPFNLREPYSYLSPTPLQSGDAERGYRSQSKSCKRFTRKHL